MPYYTRYLVFCKALVLKFLITHIFSSNDLALGEWGGRAIMIYAMEEKICVIREVHLLFLIWMPCSFLNLDFMLGDRSEVLMYSAICSLVMSLNNSSYLDL